MYHVSSRMIVLFNRRLTDIRTMISTVAILKH